MKPCPKCGKKPKQEYIGNDKWIMCHNCGISTTPCGLWKTADHEWNVYVATQAKKIIHGIVLQSPITVIS